MSKVEMAERVEKICKGYDAIFRNNWEWGWCYEKLCDACGISVPIPEGEGKKDKEHPLREKFTKWMRKVIRQLDYEPKVVTERKLQLVEAILTFEP